MIQRLSGPIFLLLLAALPATAQTARSADPFKDLDAIRLSITVGGPLDLQGGTARALFADDLKRFNRFEVDLMNALARKLETCGLFVTNEAADELSVEVFGRLEKLQQCTPRYVYMVQAKVRNSKLKGRLVPLRPVIGLADEAGVERALIDAAVAAVAAELRNCHKPAPKNGGRQ